MAITMKAMPSAAPSIRAKYLIAPVLSTAREPIRRVIAISINTICPRVRFNFNNWWCR